MRIDHMLLVAVNGGRLEVSTHVPVGVVELKMGVAITTLLNPAEARAIAEALWYAADKVEEKP